MTLKALGSADETGIESATTVSEAPLIGCHAFNAAAVSSILVEQMKTREEHLVTWSDLLKSSVLEY